MANLALYRKYRPRTFDEVIGQEHVTGPLIQALKNDKLTHAYLFSGPRGCGKTSSARILARSLNCEQGPTPHPCGECDSCVALAPNGPGSLDVIEIDAASHGGVDDARDLREKAFFAPVSSRFKVYIIDEAHMVSTQGFNALLKLVEEPPEFLKFVFATTEPEKVLQTIRSRTHHYPFRLVPPKELRELLERICAEEGVAVEPTVFPLVARAGGGSARDSLSVLDQLLAGAGPEGVTYGRAVSLLGVTDVALLDEMCDGLAAADGAAVFATVDRVIEAGHDPRRFSSDLLERLRDLVILDRVPDAASKGLLDAPADQLERMTGQALRLGAASLSRMADTVHDGLVQMRGTTSARLVLELVCARMLLPAADDSHGALMQRLERLERRFEIGGAPAATAPPATAPAASVPATPAPVRPPAPAPTPAPAPAPTPPAATGAPAAPAPVSPAPAAPPIPAAEPEPAPAAPSPAPDPAPPAKPTPAPTAPAPAATGSPAGLDAAAVRRVWPTVLDAVKQRKRTTHVLLSEATVVSVDGTTLVLTHAVAPLVRRLSEDQNVAVVQEALTEVLGVNWRIRFEGGGQTTTARTSAAAQAAGRPVSAAASGSPASTPVTATVDDGGWPTVRAVPPPTSPALSRPAPVASPAAGGPPAEEPPPEDEPDWDPDEDDDGDGSRVSVEDGAIALLAEQLGARKISEN
ncbi:MAG TPA: DNA polymerase III subunit gamma and tau [Mycobacteriales bacterium]|nr:DNA polymerase III subunit gamma and tau [Mycobacteriales bacterium]